MVYCLTLETFFDQPPDMFYWYLMFCFYSLIKEGYLNYLTTTNITVKKKIISFKRSLEQKALKDIKQSNTKQQQQTKYVQPFYIFI